MISPDVEKLIAELRAKVVALSATARLYREEAAEISGGEGAIQFHPEARGYVAKAGALEREIALLTKSADALERLSLVGGSSSSQSQMSSERDHSLSRGEAEPSAAIERDAELYRYMLGVAKANGFDSLTDAITQARLKSEGGA